MSERLSVGCVLGLSIVLSLAIAGCDRGAPFPTAASPLAGGESAAALRPGEPGEDGGDSMYGRNHTPWPRSPFVAEAVGALGAVVTGEQTYFQRWGIYTDVADTAELREKLGVCLSEPGRRWAFSVGSASVTGFTAVAEGRRHTRAQGLVVTLTYVRNQPLVWTVERRKPREAAAMPPTSG